MHVRPWSLVATLGVALLTGCDDSGVDEPADEGSTTASDEDGAGTTAAGEATTAVTAGSEGTAGVDDSSGPADGSSDGGSSAGEPSDGYPPEVLDALDLPWPPHDYGDALPDHWQTPGWASSTTRRPATRPPTPGPRSGACCSTT